MIDTPMRYMLLITSLSFFLRKREGKGRRVPALVLKPGILSLTATYVSTLKLEERA